MVGVLFIFLLVIVGATFFAVMAVRSNPTPKREEINSNIDSSHRGR